MNDLEIINGDIKLDDSGKMSEISGHDRIRQDLACWILEPLANDKTFPKFGSTLNSYIGEPAWNLTISKIKSEVARIVKNYITYQKTMYTDMASKKGKVETASCWSLDDLLTGEFSIQIDVENDTIRVNVEVYTSKGTTITVSEVI